MYSAGAYAFVIAVILQKTILTSSQSCPLNLAACPAPSLQQLPHYAATHPNDTSVFAETAFGIVSPSLTASQTVGRYGPVVLQDTDLIQSLQALNRERIPERLVHAKGAGVFGYFQVTNDISCYTKANFLQPGVKTKVGVRFSTGAGEAGSADTMYDFKGFSIKFYTKEGIQDLVGINFPVFIIRDGKLFPQLVRARKRNPQTHLFDPNSLWDFASSRTESAMFLMYFFSDIVFPTSYRTIDGFPVHTFKMVNKNGGGVFVKFHFLTDQTKTFSNMTEYIRLAGTNPDVLVQDLYDNIARGEFPSWTMKIQVMTFDQARKHPQNPFDSTKLWKEKDYPLITVGKLVLNENPLNHFAQVEQMALSPNHLVPGIEASPDRLLHTRMFAYPDTQLYRLGSNFAQLHVNRCPMMAHTYDRDGFMAAYPNGGNAPNYFPNSFHGLNQDPDSEQSVSFACGAVDRIDIGNDDNFSLPKWYWETQIKEDERIRLINNMGGSLCQTCPMVRRNALNNFAYKVSKSFGDRLKAALNSCPS